MLFIPKQRQQDTMQLYKKCKFFCIQSYSETTRQIFQDKKYDNLKGYRRSYKDIILLNFLRMITPRIIDLSSYGQLLSLFTLLFGNCFLFMYDVKDIKNVTHGFENMNNKHSIFITKLSVLEYSQNKKNWNISFYIIFLNLTINFLFNQYYNKLRNYSFTVGTLK